jgi:hypothetical protein
MEMYVVLRYIQTNQPIRVFFIRLALRLREV